ncbi:PREDICTED: uncharacterized protein LOC106728034 isoform X3 [Myotis brandtii]|uniref:uncharacterized protein LOC106728034 isoform X3 n=1 Tax=Myotis brandtii TaxID=109478 RepID=UPI0007042FFE|nr:PREDICTED: uncharacterized protein LOC106728034 isoform X3 [Myotis brandtii]
MALAAGGSGGAASYDGHQREWDRGRMVEQQHLTYLTYFDGTGFFPKFYIETKDSCGVLKAQEPCNGKAWGLNSSSSQITYMISQSFWECSWRFHCCG